MSKLEEMRKVMGWSEEEMNGFLLELREAMTSAHQEAKGKDVSDTETKLDESGKPSYKMVTITIAKYLTEIGCPKHIKGYKHLAEGIRYGLDHPIAQTSTTYEIYPHIAKVCGTTPSRVERSMRSAIERIFNNMSPLVDEVFGSSVDPNRGLATNSEFLAASAEYLQLKYFSE